MLYEDAVLWSALKRSGLVEHDGGAGTPTGEKASRFNLDTTIEDEGLNLVCLTPYS